MEGFMEVLHCKVFYCMLHLIVLQAGSIYSEVTADQSWSGNWTSRLPPVLEQKVSRTKSGETKEKKRKEERKGICMEMGKQQSIGCLEKRATFINSSSQSQFGSTYQPNHWDTPIWEGYSPQTEGGLAGVYAFFPKWWSLDKQNLFIHFPSSSLLKFRPHSLNQGNNQGLLF